MSSGEKWDRMYERTPNQDRLDAFVRDVRERYALSRLRGRSTAELEAARAAVEREIERFAASFPDGDGSRDGRSHEAPRDRSGPTDRVDGAFGTAPADDADTPPVNDGRRATDGGVAVDPGRVDAPGEPRPLSGFERDRLERVRSETVANVDRLLANRRAASTGQPTTVRNRTRRALRVASRALRALVSGRRTL